MRRFIAFGPALVVLLAAVVTLVAAPAAVRLIGYAGTDSGIRLARATLDQDNILKQIDKAVRAVADAVEPSVVHIAVDESGATRRGMRIATGSGWVFDQAGHIVTNSHVVRGAKRVMVQFQDGRAVEADLVGHDPSTDVAVVKVKTSEGLFPVQRASGLELHQGDRVYAFGSPFNFKFSMSEGIVSGLGRDPANVIGQNGYTNFIQTDAAVNPGNSGGPLVNVEGKVVGMNVAIATAQNADGTSEGQSSGISFAIPLSTIESVAEQLIGGGVVAKGYLGIERALNDDDNARILSRLGFKGHGAVVTAVQPGGPASAAGIRPDDVITKINNQLITGVPGLRAAISNIQPGDKINVEVWRKGETLQFPVVLAQLPPGPPEVKAAFEACANFGMRVDADEAGRPMVVTVIAPSRAATAGMRQKQIVTAVESAPITDIDGFYLGLIAHGLHQGRDVTITVESPSGQKKDVKISGK